MKKAMRVIRIFIIISFNNLYKFLETFGSTNLMGIRIDDEAEDELNAALTRARQNRLKDLKVASAKPIIKPELDDVNDMELEHSVGLGGGHISQLTDDRIVFDATSEQYKSIGIKMKRFFCSFIFYT
jgi:hypothetical protein